jgi:FtsZ-interacting cell division protein ZipA
MSSPMNGNRVINCLKTLIFILQDYEVYHKHKEGIYHEED